MDRVQTDGSASSLHQEGLPRGNEEGASPLCSKAKSGLPRDGGAHGESPGSEVRRSVSWSKVRVSPLPTIPSVALQIPWVTGGAWPSPHTHWRPQPWRVWPTHCPASYSPSVSSPWTPGCHPGGCRRGARPPSVVGCALSSWFSGDSSWQSWPSLLSGRAT